MFFFYKNWFVFFDHKLISLFNSILHNINTLQMWGNLVTETAFFTNFTFGFPTKQSDILLHLTHWQYWFWFWFTYYMVLYYIIFLRLIRYRVLKMSPKLSTTFRSHGKWGDLIVCFVPLSWCTNILSNSNFILRMIEWQSESSLFTLRVRGKQWYWVYKFELKSLLDISQTSANLGHNYWVSKVQPQNHQYLSFLQNKHNLTSAHNHWVSSGQKQFVNANIVTATTLKNARGASIALNSTTIAGAAPKPLTASLNHYSWAQSAYLRTSTETTPVVYKRLNLASGGSMTTSSAHALITRTDKVSNSPVTPIRLAKSSTLGRLELAAPVSGVFTQKPNSSNFYLVIKQKRYAPTKLRSGLVLNPGQMSLTSMGGSDHWVSAAQNLTARTELTGLQHNRRLLRTKRVLVLPAHTNITLITNSFDVMHSWYIPGLGVKLDCVPGRSTHHTIHIDHAGFYYGQCAEICGRYHHHMPIRVCVLPFEHFLLWWYHYGAPFFLAGNQDRAKFVKTSFKQVSW